jgi:hypothetical protein
LFDTIPSAGATAYTTETAAASSAANTTTKGELLERAKAAIEAGEQSLHAAAEALGLAQDDHSATQREMAEAVGMSASWVNKLLKWRRSGYKEHSPFGPTTKSGRVEHAQQRAKPSRALKAQEPKVTASPDPDDAAASAERRKAEYAKKEVETSSVTSPLEEFKSAVDYWLPKMDYNARCQAVEYLVAQSKVQAAMSNLIACAVSGPALPSDPQTTSADQVRLFRQRATDNGYRLVRVRSNSKAPLGSASPRIVSRVSRSITLWGPG